VTLDLLVMYRQLSADPMMVAELGPGLIFVVVGSLLIFGTLFLSDIRARQTEETKAKWGEQS